MAEQKEQAEHTFIVARAFNGLKEGYEFKKGDLGMGYYKSSTADAELQGNCDSVGHGNGKGGASVGASVGAGESSGSIGAADGGRGVVTTVAPTEAPSAHDATAGCSTVQSTARKVQLKQIPDKLVIQPDDSEAERERKRKRVRAIKSANRHAEITNERNEKMNTWQTFNSGIRGARVKGSMSGLRRGRDSIFRSTEGGRVGVVGSGSGTTEFEQRKKFKAPQ